MKFWETLGIVGVGVVTLAAILGALKDLVKVPGALWRIFGWHGRFWAFLVRLVRAVDVVLAIPARLDRNERLLAEHIAIAAPQMALLDTIARDLGVVVPIAAATLAEVKNNGGGSLKDSAHRIERALGLPEPTDRPITGPTPTITEDS